RPRTAPGSGFAASACLGSARKETATSMPRWTSDCQSRSPPTCGSWRGSCGRERCAMMSENDLLRQLTKSTGLTRAEIRRFVDLDVQLIGRGRAEATTMRRLRRARRLRRDLGLSPDAVAIILHLLDRIEALQQAQAQREWNWGPRLEGDPQGGTPPPWEGTRCQKQVESTLGRTTPASPSSRAA